MSELTVNDDVTIPGVVVCVHVETVAVPSATLPTVSEHKLRCWGATAFRIEDEKCTRSQDRSSNSTDEFWDWLNCRRLIHRPLWLFCSRLGLSMTVLQLWRLLESGEFSLHRRPRPQTVVWRRKRGHKRPEKAIPGLLITQGPPDAVVCYHKMGWKIIVLGLENYCLTLSAGSATVNLTAESSAPIPDAPLANWKLWCTEVAGRMSKVVSDLLIWHRRQELGRFGFSVAGCALAAFRHRFMEHRIYCPDDQDDRDAERQAFYPGRTEPLWVGSICDRRYTPLVKGAGEDELGLFTPKPPFYKLDARSFYGAVQSFQSVPVECIESCADASDGGPPASGRIGEYLAGVEITTATECFPVRHAGRCLYARGHYTTVLAGPELNRAYQRGCIRRWLWWKRYRLETALKRYSDVLWRERVLNEKGGNLTVGVICKQMLARLHGKFLQKLNRWEARPEMVAAEPWATWTDGSLTSGVYRKFRAVAWDVEEETDGGDAVHCFPAIAAWVTSYGREWLRTWEQIAGQVNVLYVSTDSLIVTEAGRTNLQRHGIISPSDLGGLRVVESGGNVEITRANYFTLGGTTYHSGRAGIATVRAANGKPSEIFDSLGIILHARHGRNVTSRPQQFTEAIAPPCRTILPGGWLEPAEVYSC